MTTHLPLFGALLSAAILGIFDWRSGRMPNALTLGSLLLALGLRCVVEGEDGLISALLGILCTALVPAILFFCTGGEAIGGGDVKALAALGAWLGPLMGLEVEIGSFSLMALTAMAQQAWRGQLWQLLVRSLSLLVRPHAWRGRLAQHQISHEEQFPGREKTRGEQTELLQLRFGPFLIIGAATSCGSAFFPDAFRMIALFQ